MGNPLNNENLSLEDQVPEVVEEIPGELQAAQETDEAEAELDAENA